MNSFYQFPIFPMSPIFYITVFFITSTLIAHSILLFVRRQKNIKKKLFLRLSKEGSANNLVFCSQEMLPNKVMGIDGIHRKIMIVEKIDKKYTSSIISLDEMQSCELKNSYDSLASQNLKQLEIENALSKIELQFGSKNNERRTSITFYDQVINSRREIVLMKAKAEYWSAMLSKMLVRPQQVHGARA